MTIYTYILAALLLFGSGVATGWHERVLREPAMIDAQKAADVKTCSDNQQTTKEANDDLQKDRDALAARLHTMELQHPATCVPVTRSADVRNRAGRPARRTGLSSQWLYEYGANQCSTYWQQLKVCANFVANERKVAP